jgi:hypothetical protein
VCSGSSRRARLSGFGSKTSNANAPRREMATDAGKRRELGIDVEQV